MINTNRIRNFCRGVSLFLVVAGSSAGAQNLDEAVIMELNINAQGSSVLVYLDKRFDLDCTDGGAGGLLLLDDSKLGSKLAYAALLTAYATGATVTVQSTGTCDYHNIINRVKLKK